MYKTLFYSFLLMLLAQSCAQQAQLNGGIKDIIPPKLDSLRSTPNHQLRFVKQPITLYFKEWVKLSDISKQVVVSPPLKEAPEVKLNGRAVVFTFAEKEVLKTNATYSIDFGDAIQDITEGNKVKVHYTFSTGDQLDSLVVRGVVVDALSKEPIENVLFMLYDNLADSAFHVERPFYFAKSNKQGLCSIENVRKGTYRLVSLSDLNANYMFDQPAEKHGFYPTIINISDTTKAIFTVRHFEPLLALKIKTKETARYGQVKIAYNQPLQLKNISAAPKPEQFKTFIEKDTLYVWYDKAPDRWNIIAGKDTIDVRTPSREVFVKKQALGVKSTVKYKKNSIAILVNAQNNLAHSLESNVPISAFDTKQITLQEDTLRKYINVKLQIDSINQQKIYLTAPFVSDKKYLLTLLPGALTDMYGVANKDTLQQQILVFNTASLGSITAVFKGAKANQAYIVQLLDQSGQLIKEKRIDSEKLNKYTFDDLEAGEYKFKIINDDNKNGVWDTGNYDEKRQPERIYSQSITQAVKANWEVNVEVLLK